MRTSSSRTIAVLFLTGCAPSLASPVDFVAPKIIATPSPIPMRHDPARSEEIVSASCAEGSIRLVGAGWVDSGAVPELAGEWNRRLGTCRSSGTPMSRALYDVALPALHRCIGETAPRAGIEVGSDPVFEVWHGGIINHRSVARSENLSLHAYGRAMDLVAVRVGGVHLDYFRDWSFRETGWLDALWTPLVDCLRASDGVFAMDHRSNRAHRDHIHVSVPFEERPEGVAGGD